MKILVIEDDVDAAEYIVRGLEPEGHVLTIATDGRDGLLRASCEQWDLIIVDRMLPQLDGLALLRMLRAGGVHTPSLFLTALEEVSDRVAGLQAGGDDYLVKPFALAELKARIDAINRRREGTVASKTVLRAGELEIDLLTRTARYCRERLDLQERELRILEYLMRHAGQVVTRTMLLENVWEFHFQPRTNLVESNISRLRAKIGKTSGEEIIQTVRGIGYVLRVLS